jgi:hypothetical protein
VEVYVRSAAKKSRDLASADSFRAFRGKLLEFGGAKVLKWGTLPVRGRIRPILCLVTHFPAGEGEGDWRLAAGGWWLVGVAQHPKERITREKPSDAL